MNSKIDKFISPFNKQNIYAIIILLTFVTAFSMPVRLGWRGIFHDDQSMIWSSTALIDYLYGVRHDFYYDENRKLIIKPVKIETHKTGEKEIPSGFFSQPDSEFVSAVLFSATGTISKFNRIGRQAGFYDPRIIMIRRGTCHNHDPNASMPNFSASSNV